MAQLPDWVIVHGSKDDGQDDAGVKRPLYLGQMAWTGNRSHALSFHSREEAGQWIAEEGKRPLLKDSGAVPMKIDQSTTRDAVPGTMAHDYDPYDLERA